MEKGSLPPDNSLDDVKVRIRKSYSNPNVGQIHQVVLKDGPRTFRITKKNGISQLKKMSCVCRELDMPDVSIVCFNKRNMPYNFIFKDIENCNSIEEKRAFVICEYNALVSTARSFPIMILSSKPEVKDSQ